LAWKYRASGLGKLARFGCQSEAFWIGKDFPGHPPCQTVDDWTLPSLLRIGPEGGDEFSVRDARRTDSNATKATQAAINIRHRLVQFYVSFEHRFH
jgi:hypothetical protein